MINWDTTMKLCLNWNSGFSGCVIIGSDGSEKLIDSRVFFFDEFVEWSGKWNIKVVSRARYQFCQQIKFLPKNLSCTMFENTKLRKFTNIWRYSMIRFVCTHIEKPTTTEVMQLYLHSSESISWSSMWDSFISLFFFFFFFLLLPFTSILPDTTSI